MILYCRPIRSNKTPNNAFENIILEDSNGYPWALLFMDIFYNKEDDKIYNAIKKGEPFQIKVDINE